MIRAVILCLLAVGWMPSVVIAQQQDELLEPERAFAFSARATASDRIEVSWDIADGYYMYHDKYRVNLVQGDVRLGDLDIPPGQKKQDEFFGEVEIHHGKVTINVPVERSGTAATTVVIEAEGQGCNEPIGVCYPPLKQTATLQLAALTVEPAAPAANEPAVGSLQSLRDLLSGGADDEFLDPDQAFKLDVEATDGEALRARFVIEPGYYLYRDKVSFISRTPEVVVGDFTLPPGKEKEDEYFGKIVAYYDGFEFVVPLVRSGTAAVRAEFDVGYQGCADKGICYPPITKTITVPLAGIGDAAAAAPPVAERPEPVVLPDGESKQGYWQFIIAAFVTGLLLTFTPCVLPMVPILTSIIVGQGGQVTKTRGGLLAGAYVLGTAVTYTIAGVVAGATGEQLQAYFQNPWAIGTIAAILAVLALSMFGLYDIQMPSFVQSKLQTRTQGLGGGAVSVVFILGLVSALIVGACVSPLLITALGVAIMKGDPVLGGAIMFAMALGMGVFLIALGFGAGFLLPKAGAWMDRVKQAFGVLLLAVAIYLLGILPEVPVLYLWSALFIITAVYLGALQSLPEGASGWQYLWKGAGVFLLVWGVLALLGGMAGHRDILRPVDLASGPGLVSATGGGEPAHNLFTRVSTTAELDEHLAQAKEAGKPVILDYYAEWCVDCVRMEKKTFQNPKVAEVIKDRFVLMQVDVTDPNNPDTKAIKKRYGVYGPPAMLFFDRSGAERRDLRRYGFMEPDQFLGHLRPLG